MRFFVRDKIERTYFVCNQHIYMFYPHNKCVLGIHFTLRAYSSRVYMLRNTPLG